MRKSTLCIIGIVGLPGAGKTTIADYLVRRKFSHIILSDFIKEEIIARGLTDFSRLTYQRIGNEIRERRGGDILARLAMKKIRRDNIVRAVIDGIRNIQEIAYLRRQKHFHLLGVTAQASVRFARLSERRTTDKQIRRSYTEFLREERREDSLGSKKSGLRVRESLKQADGIVRNSFGKKALYTKINGFFMKWTHE